VQRELRDRGVEHLAGLGHHLEVADHGARRGRQRAAGDVAERLARPQFRLFADHAGALDLGRRFRPSVIVQARAISCTVSTPWFSISTV
jgi:hypothetical protein